MAKKKKKFVKKVKVEMAGPKAKPSLVRVKTGIAGFDKLVNGGFPKGSVVLVSGAAGTGKSAFAYQFVYNGAKNGEPGLIISFEEKREKIIERMVGFGMREVDRLLREKKLSVLNITLKDVTNFMQQAQAEIRRLGTKRVMIDSISMLSLFYEHPYRFRESVANISNILQEMGCTVVMTSELPAETKMYASHQAEAFAVDGIVLLFHKMIGNVFVRALCVVKMRETGHSERVHPIRINEKGLTVYPDEAVLEEFHVL